MKASRTDGGAGKSNTRQAAQTRAIHCPPMESIRAIERVNLTERRDKSRGETRSTIENPPKMGTIIS